MSKKIDKTIQNNIFNLCDKMIKYIHCSTSATIKLYEIQYKDLLLEKEYLLANEPFKIFKKKHMEWENQIKIKEDEIKKILKKMDEEVKSIQNYKD